MIDHPMLRKAQGWHIDVCGATVCALVTAVIYFLGMSPVWEAQAERRTVRQEISDQSQLALRLKNEMRQLSNRLATSKQTLRNTPLQLQPAQRVNQRIAEVTGAASDCGLIVAHVRPLRVTMQGKHAIVPIELSGTGTFRQCLKFLRSCNDVFLDSGVASLELSTSPGDVLAPVVFQIRVHWYVEPVTASLE